MRSVGVGVTYSLTLFRGLTPFLDAMMTYNHAFTACFYISLIFLLYVYVFGVILAILSAAYRTVKQQMFYHSTVEPQDYEMVDFMMKRFKQWLHIDSKQKPVRQQAETSKTAGRNL